MRQIFLFEQAHDAKRAVGVPVNNGVPVGDDAIFIFFWNNDATGFGQYPKHFFNPEIVHELVFFQYK